MKRSLSAAVLAIALGGSLAVGVPTAAVSAAKPATPPIFHCDGTYTDRTFKHVRVAEGDTCVLRDSLVTGNFMARKPRTVKIIDTEVRRNIMVRGAARDVVIGNAGCRFDPPAGNNIKVVNSHNVLICWMTVKNNVTVKGNDGRISLFNNTVGRNIDVSRNDAYAPLRGESTSHARAGAIRLRGNTAGGHIRLFDNDPSRQLLGLAKNTPVPETR